jgi:hypothetical protein
MTGVFRAIRFPFLVAGWASACAPAAPQSAEEICARRLAGDLVVTEFMADPQDSDTGKQYIELYNTTAADIELDGLSLFQSLSDGSREKATVLSGARVPGRGYFVLGDIASNAVIKPSYLDYGYATRLGALRHVAGRLGVRCGTKLIDSVSYPTVASGHARELDGALPPDSARSALDQNWCNEMQALAELPPAGENFGTPGTANSVCAEVTTAGTCVDAMLGEARAIQAPAPGDLLISEVMAAPAAVSQAAGEWFELYARADVDLNGLTVRSGTSLAVLSGASCLHVASGSYAVLARNSDPRLNAGLPEAMVTVDVMLRDDSSFLSISSGDTALDEVRWTAAKKGVAWQLSSSALNAAPEQRVNAFCSASRVYGQGDKGSPGAPNDVCAQPIPDQGDAGSQSLTDAGAVASTCLDSINGQPRDSVRPRVGDLLITEVLPAPTTGNGGPGEWFEVLANADLDLNGLLLSNESGSGAELTNPACLSVKAGEWLLFARGADAAKNGGLPPVTATFSFALADAMSATQPERAVVLGFDGSELDRATWTKSTRGTSVQRARNELGATASDTSTWCLSPSTTTFGAGDRGTPAAPNLGCP